MTVVSLPDGRAAQLWTGGADDGPLVVVCHGTPDSRWVAMTGAEAARTAGVRLLCVNRPGYGASTPVASTPTSVADDVVAVLDRLGQLGRHGRVAVLGMSVGGIYAAALAARHPARVAALGVVASPMMTADGSEPDPAEFEAWAAGLDVTDPDDGAVTARWLAAQPPADALLLGRMGAGWVAASAREALARPDGYLQDSSLLGRDWGYQLQAVHAPTELWFGEDDHRAPPATGRWWADRISGSRLVVRPATTHLSTLLAHWPDVLSTLAAHL